MTALLLTLTLKGLLVLLVAALAARLLRRAPASARHGVWAAAFGALLLLPVLEAVGPDWKLGVLPAERDAVAFAPLAPVAPLAPIAPAPPVPPTPPAAPAPGVFAFDGDVARFEAEVAAFEGTVEAEMAAFEAEMRAFEAEAEAFGAEAEAFAAQIEAGTSVFAANQVMPVGVRPSRSLGTAGMWAGIVWALGALVVGLGWLAAYLAARRIVAEARPETDADWGVLAERARRLSGIEGPVRLLRTDALDVPIAWGLGAPAVVLPATADAWDEDRREAVLLHEMAHLRRRDAWTQALAQAALALHWMNPLAWWGYRHFLQAREQACDDAVLAGGARPSDYAAHLVTVARGLRREPAALAAVAPMARRGPLEGRIVSILDRDRRRGSCGRIGQAATLALATLVIVPVAAVQPVARALDAAPAALSMRAEALAPAAPAAPPAFEPVAVRADTDSVAARRDVGRDLDRARRAVERAERIAERVRAEAVLTEAEMEAIQRDALAAAEAAVAEIEWEDLEAVRAEALADAEHALADLDWHEIEAAQAEGLAAARAAIAEADLGAESIRAHALAAAEAALDEVDWDELREVQREAIREARHAIEEASREAREEARHGAREAVEEAFEQMKDARDEARRARKSGSPRASARILVSPLTRTVRSRTSAVHSGPSAPPAVVRYRAKAEERPSAPRVVVVRERCPDPV